MLAYLWGIETTHAYIEELKKAMMLAYLWGIET